MCKYREQVLGFEAEVGLAQESHHHHVEGIGTGEAEPGHGHHHHGHDHDHGHHPYPHADHPLGPKSLDKGLVGVGRGNPGRRKQHEL